MRRSTSRSRSERADAGALGLAQVVAVLVVVGLLATVFVASQAPERPSPTSELRTITSQQELAEFLDSRDVPRRSYGGEAVVDAVAQTSGDAPEASDHSTTNVQVEGVDEADIVKTDGRHIYVVTEGRVVIARAHPVSKAGVVGEISLPNATAETLYLDGDRLVVLGRHGSTTGFVAHSTVEPAVSSLPVPGYGESFVRVYDVADPSDPRLERNVTVDGDLVSSRRIGDHVYVVLDASVIFDGDDEPIVPETNPDQDDFPKIHHFNQSDSYFRYTTVLSVPVRGVGDVESESYLLGSSTLLYASTSNLYVASPVLGDAEVGWARRAERTRIDKIALDEGRIDHVATGEVPGRVLDQFSMDEHDGHLRVATTVGHVSRGLADDKPSSNNVYVLDGDLQIVGRIEGVAPGERIYSARFMGDRAYLVTFKKVDPFFVLDLSEPTDPTVLGELKLPGYSDYLHPIGDDHVVGIGKDTVAAASGDFAWYQGVKIAVFDASDVQNPRVLDDVVIGDRGTESPVLGDHKALLHEGDRGTMALPILRAEIEASDYDGEPSPDTRGDPVWQGVYVFDVSTADGLSLRGTIPHAEGEHDLWEHRDAFARRTVRIGDVLYTVSNSLIKASDADDLEEQARIDLAR